MKTRIITGTVLTIVLAALIYFGEGEYAFIFSGFCVLLAGLAAFEFTRMRRYGKNIRWFDYLGILNTMIFANVAIFFLDSISFYIYIFVILLFIMLLYSIIFVSVKEFTREDFSNQILTILYCSLGFIAFSYLRQIDILMLVYLLIVSMVTDVFAYFVGVKFGKHRLALHISPKKSVEGAIGGLVFGALAATLFGYFLEVFNYAFIYILLLSFVLSSISQIGDLIASKFKREVGIKDYSKLLPGHGGILDRFDSSMFAAVFLMLALIIF